MNTVAAHHLVDGRPVIVVDFGTTTNFDVVNARGDFMGGALAPGIEISLDALAARAAQLRKVELVAPRGPIGKSTVEALQSGILYGFAGQVDGLTRRLSAALHPGRPGRCRGHRHRRSGAAAHRTLRDRQPLRARTDPHRAAPDLRAQHLIMVEQVDLRIFTEPQQGATYDDLLAVARASERLGFDAFFRSDHYLSIGDGDGDGDGRPAPTHG